MRIAIASMGSSPEALVGVRFGMCSQFLVFDTDTQEYVVIGVPPRTEVNNKVSLAAIRAVAKQDVSVIITGHIKDVCRQTMLSLGIDVVDGVTGMTVAEAIHRYMTTGMDSADTRRGFITKVAIVAEGEGLDAVLAPSLQRCTSFVVIDPETSKWERVDIPENGPAREVNLKALRTVVKTGACAVITPEIHTECCMALQALAVAVYIAPAGITVRDAVTKYQRGELEETVYTL